MVHSTDGPRKHCATRKKPDPQGYIGTVRLHSRGIYVTRLWRQNVKDRKQRGWRRTSRRERRATDGAVLSQLRWGVTSALVYRNPLNNALGAILPDANYTWILKPRSPSGDLQAGCVHKRSRCHTSSQTFPKGHVAASLFPPTQEKGHLRATDDKCSFPIGV